MIIKVNQNPSIDIEGIFELSEEMHRFPAQQLGIAVDLSLLQRNMTAIRAFGMLSYFLKAPLTIFQKRYARLRSAEQLFRLP